MPVMMRQLYYKNTGLQTGIDQQWSAIYTCWCEECTYSKVMVNCIIVKGRDEEKLNYSKHTCCLANVFLIQGTK